MEGMEKLFFKGENFPLSFPPLVLQLHMLTKHFLCVKTWIEKREKIFDMCDCKAPCSCKKQVDYGLSGFLLWKNRKKWRGWNEYPEKFGILQEEKMLGPIFINHWFGNGCTKLWVRTKETCHCRKMRFQEVQTTHHLKNFKGKIIKKTLLNMTQIINRRTT